MRIHCSLARLIAIALATVAAVALPSPAHASLFPQVWQLTDGFEVDPSDTWSCWHSVEDPMFVNGCNIGNASPNPHSGFHTSWIQANSGWSDVGRSVHLDPFLPGRTLSCEAQMWGRVLTTNTQLHGQLEVIDSATWTYVTIMPFLLTKSHDLLIWRAITTSWWVPPRGDVFIRIGLIGENLGELDALEVDDLGVACLYF